jgi:hypothetical protein
MYRLVSGFIDKSLLQVITTLSLISTCYKTPQHPLSLFQPAVPSPAVPWQRLPTVEILQLHALRSYLHRLPRRTQLNFSFKVKVKVTLRSAVYRQSVHLGVKTLETHDQ